MTRNGTSGPRRKRRRKFCYGVRDILNLANFCLRHAVSDSIQELKWKSDRTQPVLFDASKHKTLPYITAKPDITFKSLTGDESVGQLKFIILATDGRECRDSGYSGMLVGANEVSFC